MTPQRPPSRALTLIALALASLVPAACGPGSGAGPTADPTTSSSGSPATTPAASATLEAASFGATGDGRTDDGLALRTALDAAAERASALVLHPGTYLLTDGLILPDGVSVRAAKGTAWLKGDVTVGSNTLYAGLRLGDDGPTSCVVARDTHNVAFRRCRFTVGVSSDEAVLSLTEPCHDLTFRGCTIGPGAANGISIVDKGGTVRNVSFLDCTVKSSGRMGFECISRGDGRAIYQDILLSGCVFEPQGSQAISFDGPGLPADCVVDDVVIEGAGENPAFPWDAGFEINGPTKFTIRRLVIERTRGSMLNLTCSAPRSEWTFTDCTFDYTKGSARRATAPDARTISAVGMNSAVFTRCAFNAGEAAFNNGWLSTCMDNDLRTCTLLGAGSRANMTLVDGSSGNLLP